MLVMEKKGKTFSIIGGIVLAVIAIYLGIRFVSWFIRALLFGVGGFIMGFIFGAIWMNKRNKLKGTDKEIPGGKLT
jgi:molybdopterin-binding protein